MKILILTQYYPPETGAPQNRLHELALELIKLGVEIEVLTAMPNYPKMEIFNDYRGKKFLTEKIDGITVYRSSIYVKKSKKILFRLVNYFSFVFSSMWYGSRKLPKYDFILVESPPLFLGISGYFLAKRKKAKLIFNVSDLWPESAEKMGLVSNKLFLKAATILEEFLYKKSILITGQTQGIVKNIKNRFPNKNVYWLPNGVDLTLYNPENIESNWRKEKGFEDNDILLIYAGIIGHAQGLEVILKAADILKNEQNIKFLLIGDGPVKNDLLEMQKKHNLENVVFYDSVPKGEISKIIKSSDGTIIPLKKIPLFEGAIPSKIFENLAMKKPIILGVIGEAKELFIEEANAGIAFEPENEHELVKAIRCFISEKEKIKELGENGRTYVNKKFNRSIIAKKLFNELTKL